MDKGHSPYHALHEAIWQDVEGRETKNTGLKVRTPPFVPAEDGYSDARIGDDFPVLRHLDAAIAIAKGFELAHLAEAFASLAYRLPWSQNPLYTEVNSGPSLLAGYAYASLSGPEGPIRCLAPRGGFYLMGPHVTYPEHHHEPREIYLVLTPGARWSLDGGDWFEAAPGDLIYHEPWQMHAMQSGDQPVLAYAGWVEPGNRHEVKWRGAAIQP